MEAKLQKVTRYILELNEEEASWLRAVMQNPINLELLQTEDEYDTDMRSKFFSAVESAGRPR